MDEFYSHDATRRSELFTKVNQGAILKDRMKNKISTLAAVVGLSVGLTAAMATSANFSIAAASAYGAMEPYDFYVRVDDESVPVPSAHLEALQDEFRPLWSLSDNWDEEGAIAPLQHTLEKAWHLVTSALVSHRDMESVTPMVSIEPDGNVVCEWQHGDKRISLFIGADEISYVRSWGENIHSNMDDGILTEPRELRAHMTWLTHDAPA